MKKQTLLNIIEESPYVMWQLSNQKNEESLKLAKNKNDFYKVALSFFISKGNMKFWKDNKIDELIIASIFNKKNYKSYIKLINSINKKPIINRFNMIIYLDLAEKLIKNKYNKDIVLNLLSTQINPEVFVLSKFPSVTQIKEISKIYSSERIIKLLDKEENSQHEIKEILSLIKELNRCFSEQEIKDYKVFSKKPKSLKEIHDRISFKINEKKQFNVEDFPLSPREDLLKIDNKSIFIDDKEFIVKIAKTKLDLIKFSQSNFFSNCVGTSPVYGENARKGLSTIIGVFSKENKPMYCIETGVYNFKQARGVGNEMIPNNIYIALENLLTIAPTLPEDFVQVSHSFIFGFKYIPEDKNLYISFRKGNMYIYKEVPSDVYESFATLPNKGQLLNSVIKKYNYERI